MVAPQDLSKITCACGNYGRLWQENFTEHGGVYLGHWVIVWLTPDKKYGWVQKYPGYRPKECIPCAIAERDRRRDEHAKWLAEEATRKVNNEPKKRSWLHRLWG